MRSSRFVVASISAGIMFTAFTACHSDSVTAAPYTECLTEPGCQLQQAPVAAEVVQALDDASSRAVFVLPPAARKTIEANLTALASALSRRDIARGRVALAAAFDAIAQAERAHGDLLPDLGAIRLGLVPAARSLGVDISVVVAPAR